MNYGTAWFIGLLGRIDFSPQPNNHRIRFQSGQDHLIQAILEWMFWYGSESDCRVHICLNKPN